MALNATTATKELMSPFYSNGGPVPLYFIQEWVITAADSKGVITIKVG